MVRLSWLVAFALSGLATFAAAAPLPNVLKCSGNQALTQPDGHQYYFPDTEFFKVGEKYVEIFNSSTELWGEVNICAWVAVCQMTDDEYSAHVDRPLGGGRFFEHFMVNRRTGAVIFQTETPDGVKSAFYGRCVVAPDPAASQPQKF